ncbi:hypothetical protein [Bacillus sp. FJAT-27251]|uniref:hypothetical protein n=1 Tax=Bacillus sp. FJAT-27251 TaxID=1684142 RepID=UPI0006A7C723|nr:hypothetical protein [Bacillus sp. FJAT-27251]
MKIMTREELEHLFNKMQPVLDLSAIITVDDEELTLLLHYYLFLTQFEQEIAAISSLTYETVLYSQCYWFHMFKKGYFEKFGYDAGMDDEASLLVENLVNELEGEVDWELLERIHT